MMDSFKYKTSKTPPPCYQEAQKRFGVNFYRDGVVFTYGDTIHFYKGSLTPDIIVHEKVHIRQQTSFEGGAAAWWGKYFIDEEFRLSQELEAYRAQWAYVQRAYRSNTHAHHLAFYAKSLCMIYKLPGMNVEKASALIEEKE